MGWIENGHQKKCRQCFVRPQLPAKTEKVPFRFVSLICIYVGELVAPFLMCKSDILLTLGETKSNLSHDLLTSGPHSKIADKKRINLYYSFQFN